LNARNLTQIVRYIKNIKPNLKFGCFYFKKHVILLQYNPDRPFPTTLKVLRRKWYTFQTVVGFHHSFSPMKYDQFFVQTFKNDRNTPILTTTPRNFSFSISFMTINRVLYHNILKYTFTMRHTVKYGCCLVQNAWTMKWFCVNGHITQAETL
jgi:hypothetical protein